MAGDESTQRDDAVISETRPGDLRAAFDLEGRMRDLLRASGGRAAEAALHHLDAGGSRVRASLALDAGAALGLDDGTRLSIAAACELLHNASLIHDDLQDQDPVRRGREAVWARFGADVAVCAGDLMLSAAYAALAGAGPRAGALIAHAHARVATVIAGQCADLDPGPARADAQAYERIAAAKSGPLLSLPLELALMASGREDRIEAAARAAEGFAIAYQISDDLNDAEQDAASGELNIVAVLAAGGEQAPSAAAAARAHALFEAARREAGALPRGAGARLADYAARMGARVAPAETAA